MNDGDRPLRDRLVGTWRLVAWESVGADGSVELPMGPAPEGVLVYTADGTMITTMGRSGRAPIGGGDVLGGPDEARLAALDSFVAYAGTWRADEGDVVHTVTMSLYPDWVGTQQRRHVGLDAADDRLTLAADAFRLAGRVGRQVVTWVRVG